jgi:hypothetical protein
MDKNDDLKYPQTPKPWIWKLDELDPLDYSLRLIDSNGIILGYLYAPAAEAILDLPKWIARCKEWQRRAEELEASIDPDLLTLHEIVLDFYEDEITVGDLRKAIKNYYEKG